MSIKVYDFYCPTCDKTVEGFVRANDTVDCYCGTRMQRLIPAPRIDRSHIALSSSASPESVAHFDRVHRERRAIEEKSLANHGDYGKSAGSD